MKYNYLKNLAVGFIFLATFSSNAQNSYSISPIPHQVYNSPNQASLTTEDDRYSQVISLNSFSDGAGPAFKFDFFGVTYDKIIVSTNGYIDFRYSLAGSFSPYSFSQTIPNVSFPVKNSIFGCYYDMNNDEGIGAITYTVIGAAPFRKFIVIFDNQPLYVCQQERVSFQMILYETLNIIDVQVVNKPVYCSGGFNRNAVIGLINESGTIASTPPGRNTGVWSATQEGWRFTPSTSATLSVYKYIKCDSNLDGIENFNLQIIRNDLSAPNMTFYETLQNAYDMTFSMPTIYTNNVANYQKIYGRKSDDSIIEIILRTINCNDNIDYDLDQIPTTLEDLNSDGNLANDDTDSDGIPNFLDNDDDGDMVLTSFEYVFALGRNTTALLDTDNDGIPNYLDNDDDGDGVLTINEDYDHNGNPADDDTNSNSIPDYLEFTVALGVKNHDFSNSVSLYPNPASTVLNIENKSGEQIKSVSIYSITGALVKQTNTAQSIESISVSELQTGMYFVKMQIGNQVVNSKFIKK